MQPARRSGRSAVEAVRVGPVRSSRFSAEISPMAPSISSMSTAVLRAVCSCGWTGPEHAIDWASIGETVCREAALTDTCLQDWDGHTAGVEATTVPLPAEVTDLVERLVEEIEKLARTSPVAVVKAARQLEVAAARLGYWAAHGTHKDTPRAQRDAEPAPHQPLGPGRAPSPHPGPGPGTHRGRPAVPHRRQHRSSPRPVTAGVGRVLGSLCKQMSLRRKPGAPFGRGLVALQREAGAAAR